MSFLSAEQKQEFRAIAHKFLHRRAGKMIAEADENKDGIISIKELKNYLLTEVEILTNGAQRATSRSANKGISWNIWE